MSVQSTQAVAAIAEKYRQRGYIVTFDPPANLLPVGVQGYRPDFVAFRDDEKVAVEVKSRRSLGADPTLMQLAERFRQQPGWRLDIAVIEDTEKVPPPAVLSATEVAERLARADKFAAETGDYAAALLLLWTAIEAVLHARLRSEQDDRPVSPNRLGKLAYSLGLVDDEQLPLIEWLVTVRNDVVHGRKPPDVSLEAYRRARQLADHILNSHPEDESTGPSA